MLPQSNDKHWYAFKIFFSKAEPIKAYFQSQGYEYFYDVQKTEKGKDGKMVTHEVPVVSTLIFLCATRCEAEHVERLFLNRVMLYRYTNGIGMRVPSIISEHEIKIFRIVAESGIEGLDFHDEFMPQYTKGDRVRVTHGPLKGAEGYIVRIKKNHHLYVSITGLCAITTGYVPKAYLEKVEE